MTAPTPEDVKAQYGFVALLAQAVPEIGSLMQKAVNEKWTAERFQMSVASTNWWKQTAQPARQWITQQVADPASANRLMQTGADRIGGYALKFGFQGMSRAEMSKIWLDGQLAGYDDEALQQLTWNRLWDKARATGQMPSGGEFGLRVQRATELAYAYGYQPGNLDMQLRDVVGEGLRNAQSGDAALVSWTDKLKNYASSKYAPFSDRIQAGETVRDIAQPYIDMYSQTLEVNPQDVALDDKHLQRWLQGQSEAGKPPAATAVWQAQQDLRKDTRWGYTNNAKQAAAETATVIGRAFGMVG